jgi:hypothetical protein
MKMRIVSLLKTASNIFTVPYAKTYLKAKI